MKKQLFATAALLALGAQAQVSGPNRTGPGTSPGTFSTPTPGTFSTPTPGTFSTPSNGTFSTPPPIAGSQIPATVPPATSSFDTLPPVVNDAPARLNNDLSQPFATDPVTGPRNGVLPNTTIGTPNGINPQADQLRARGSFRSNGALNDFDDLDDGAVGAPPESEFGTDAGRLTPIPTPLGTQGQLPSTNQMTTTGITVPPRIAEQPLDKALSAKIRAQLSATQPLGAQAAPPLSPEIVRDLRITSQNGRVTLEGMVENEQQRALIEQRAKQVLGVASIDDRLTVRGSANNQAVGAPAGSQSGFSDSLNPSTNSTPRTGESPRNQSDLDDLDSDPGIAPDK